MRTIKPLSPTTAAAYGGNTVVNSRYTLGNFLFLNLYEQFGRPLNAYFLLVVMLQFFSVIAPVNPLSTFLPLAFAFLLTAAKEGYDDYKRHKSDLAQNSKRFHVMRGAGGAWEWEWVQSKDIRAGDVIRLVRNDEIPADCVALSCPIDAHGIVYIRTDNMDGEIDLKPREVVPLAAAKQKLTSPLPEMADEVGAHLLFGPSAPPTAIASALDSFELNTQPPSVSIDRFDARLLVEGEGKASLSQAHLLPQSCFIKNTAEVIALVVYTGKDTKAALNKSPTPIKWAKIDKDVSRYSKYIFIAQLTCAALCGIVGFSLSHGFEHKHWYVKGPKRESTIAAIIYPLRFFLLTTVMIPISFKFVVDISKYFMALTIEWDLNMWDEERGEGAKVRNSSILEDLGQIEHVLSDKTGTMTTNEMVLREVSIFGHRVLLLGDERNADGTDKSDAPLSPANATEPATEDQINTFWHTLAVCNSVEVEEKVVGSGSFTYAAVSPDEEALCKAAAAHGRQLIQRSKTHLTLSIKPAGFAGAGTNVTLRVEQTFPFSSELKCMSVLITDDHNGKSYLVCKGADDKLMGLLSPAFVASAEGASRIRKVQEDLDGFAQHGLRTLLVCRKELPAAVVAKFNDDHKAALLEMEDRHGRLLALRQELEKDFELIGATAIEDCLQEGVAHTMSDLLDANIKVWMLTGDKVETAEQIALSCGLMAPNDTILAVYGAEWEKHLREAANPGAYTRRMTKTLPGPASSMQEMVSPREGTNGTVLVVQGGSVLERIWADKELQQRFISISGRCKSVVCARVTPIQKAQVTAMVRKQGKLTLAIGDGGNDVAMLQEAHVGVGILGREGKQAAMAADFSVTKFRYLSPLLFYHGHQSYMRTAFVVQYSFYKSMLISFIQIAFNIWVTGMSGGSFWDSLSLTAWNGLYTLPQTIFFVFDRVAPRTVLEQNPFLYRLPQRGYGLTPFTFFGNVFKGILQSITALWLIYSITAAPFTTSELGQTESSPTTFLSVFSAFMWLQIGTVLLESRAVGLFNAIAIIGMPLAYYLISDEFYNIPVITASGGFRHSMTIIQHFATLFIAVSLYVPHLLASATQKIFYPTALDVLRRDEVDRLSAKGYIVSTAQSTKLVMRGMVSKILLAAEIVARGCVTVEERGEESQRRKDAEDRNGKAKMK